LIQQFFATLEFDTQDVVGFTWMTDEVTKISTITCFGKLLGYTFDGIDSPIHACMHLDTTEYNKRKIQCLYGLGGKAGETADPFPFTIFCFGCFVPTFLQVLATMTLSEVV
jgi:hypothetical protein